MAVEDSLMDRRQPVLHVDSNWSMLTTVLKPEGTEVKTGSVKNSAWKNACVYMYVCSNNMNNTQSKKGHLVNIK